MKSNYLMSELDDQFWFNRWFDETAALRLENDRVAEDLGLAKFFLETMHPQTDDYCACSVCDFLERDV